MKQLIVLVFAIGIIGFVASDANGQCYGGGGYYGGYHGGHHGYYGGGHYYRPAVSFHYQSYPRYGHGYHGGYYRPHYGYGHGHGHGGGYIRYGNYGGRSGWSFGIGF